MHCQITGISLGHLAGANRPQHQIFQNGQMRKKVKLLKHHPNIIAQNSAASGAVINNNIVNPNLARLMALKPVDTADQG